MKKKLFGKLKGDRIMWGIILCLSIISIFIVYSTGSKLAAPQHKESLWHLFSDHIIYLILGFFVMYVMSDVNYRRIGRLAKIGLLVAVFLLLWTLIFGKSVGGAKRSLEVFKTSFQVIQLIEVLFIIYFALWVSRVKSEINNFKSVLLPMLGYVVITCALIIPQKASGGIIMGVTYFAILFVSQLKKKYFFAVSACVLITGGMFLSIILNSEVGILQRLKSRVESHIGIGELNKETIITEAAVSRGGLLPNPGGSVLKGSVSESFSDYIYAFLIEEYGILLGIAVILLYLGLFYRIRRAAIHIQSTFGAYLSVGLGFFIVFQAFTHILVCVGYFPATGETLPMISRGGMSILTMSFCLGILLNISEEAKEDKKTENVKSET